jgi:hypothetical protein
MIKMVVQKGTAKNKKLKAVFFDAQGKKIKTTQFGDSRYEDYTTSKNKMMRTRYRERHKKDLSKGDYMSAGHLSYHILWGPSTSRKTNIASYKKRYGLK